MASARHPALAALTITAGGKRAAEMAEITTTSQVRPPAPGTSLYEGCVIHLSEADSVGGAILALRHGSWSVAKLMPTQPGWHCYDWRHYGQDQLAAVKDYLALAYTMQERNHKGIVFHYPTREG